MSSNNTVKTINNRRRSIKRSKTPSKAIRMESLKRLILYLQDNLSQVEQELENCQNNTQKFEYYMDSNSTDRIVQQTNKNNDYSEKQMTSVDNTMLPTNKIGENGMKKRIEKIMTSNKELHSMIERIKDDRDKKERLLRAKTDQCNNLNEGIKKLKEDVVCQNKEIQNLNDKYQDQLKIFQNKINLLEKEDLMNKYFIEEMEESLKSKTNEISKNLKSIDDYQKKEKEFEYQIQLTKETAENDIKNYEKKVKEIIEELKNQNTKISNEYKEISTENSQLKMDITAQTESQSIMSKTIEEKETQIDQLKQQLTREFEKSDNFKKQYNQWQKQRQEYDEQVKNLVSDRDRYYKMSLDQDNAIQNLLKEIKQLSNQLKAMKLESAMDFSEDGSYSVQDSTVLADEYDIDEENRDICNSNNCCNYTITASNLNNVEDSDFESSLDENVNKKVSTLVQSFHQDSFHKTRDIQNDGYIGIEQFSKYLEEQLKLIKIANENNKSSLINDSKNIE